MEKGKSTHFSVIYSFVFIVFLFGSRLPCTATGRKDAQRPIWRSSLVPCHRGTNRKQENANVQNMKFQSHEYFRTPINFLYTASVNTRQSGSVVIEPVWRRRKEMARPSL
jgi:hypothetical protein